jgi:hypothetical protein
MPELQQRWPGLPHGVRLLLGSAAALGAAYLYARYLEPARLATPVYDVGIARLPPAFDGYRIAHLSDLHYSPTMPADRLYRVVEAVNAAMPDCIVITGDFVTAGGAFDGALYAALLRDLRARDGVYAVWGNHDHRPHLAAVRRVVEAAGIRLLNNAAAPLTRAAGTNDAPDRMARIWLAGVDSVYRRMARLDRTLAALEAGGAADEPAILLAHEPDFADVAAATGRFALQLSGHAHGFQVAIPVLARLGLPDHGTRYVRGWKFVNGMLLYASRGIGTTSAPLRFNAVPEAALHVLRAPQA